MTNREESWAELLERLGPLLVGIFAEYGVSPLEAQEVVEEAFLVLMSKRPPRKDPEGWLLRTIAEKCRKLGEEAEPADLPDMMD
jgi:DNA-directed RNA polymerase specialized sigma24 family protein